MSLNSIALIAGKSNIKFTPKEQELFNIFFEEYNDIFPNILNMSERAIFDLIVLNVTTLLGENNFNSYSKLSLAKIQSYIKSQYYMQDLIAIKQIREIILSSKNNSSRFPPLKKSDIIPHCSKTSKCYHICGNELLYPKALNFIICLNCKMIFYEDQIHLLCKECNEDYFSDIYINEEKKEDFIRATWDKYHCKNFFPEDMKCPKCNEGIFFSPKKRIYKCLKCNWENKIKTMVWNCMLCNKDFYSGVTSYIKFENKPDKILYLKTLINKIPAKPNFLPCCNIDIRNVEFTHSPDCDGLLYLGTSFSKKIIICSKCKETYDYNKMDWYCPHCGENFNCNQRKIIRPMSENHRNKKVNTKKKNYENDYKIMEFDSFKKHMKYDSNIPMSDHRNNYIKHVNTLGSVDKFEKNSISGIKHINSINHKQNLPDYIIQEFKPNQTHYNNTNENYSHVRKCPTNLFDDVKKNVNFNVNVNININNIYKNNNKSNHKQVQDIFIKKAKTLIEPNENFNDEDFKRNKLIGEGTFGKIYCATWNKNNLTYALKELISHSTEEINQIRNEYDLMLNFYKKTKCSGIIKVYGAQSQKKKDGNYYFYVLMELANTDWEKEIKKRGKVKNFYTEGELLTIAKRLIRTFSELQKYGISHRDIKPQNVLVIDNDYKICDFGEAKIIKNNQSEIHTLRGTELYMSPILFNALKQKKNEVYHNSFKSDVFSLGMCMALGASLNFKTLCEIREVNDMDKVKNILVKYLIAKYSYEFINILLMMLEIDENKRLDFIQLEDKVRD